MAKKKANPQSQDDKPPKTQDQAIDDAASEKLHSLKSLNAMLLKETVERRHQVDSLTQINESLESELNRCKFEKVSLQTDLNGVTERAAILEIETGLVSKFVAEQMSQMEDVNRSEKVAMEVKIGGLERDISRLLEEISKIERVKNKKESEIVSLNSRVKSLVAEIGEEKFVLSQVCEERDETRAQLDDRIRYGNGLKAKLDEAEKREAVVLEKSRKLKVDYDGLVEEKMAVEAKIDSILKEKDSVERNLVERNGLVEELKRDIQKIVKEKAVIEDDRNTQERKVTELQISVDGLNQLVDRLQKREEQLLKKVADLEKKCVVSSVKESEMHMQIDVLAREKQEIEGSVQKLSAEKSLVMKDLKEALKKLEHQKHTIDQMVQERTKIDDAKREAESSIVKLQEQLVESKKTVVALKQLESDVSHYRSALDQATAEKNKAEANLNEEKLKVKDLSEKISKMEKGIEETNKKLSKMTKDTNKLVAKNHELEGTRAALAVDIAVVKKSLTKTQKEHDETKAKLQRAEANSSKMLKILKKTSLICNSEEGGEMGMDEEGELGEDMKHHVAEVEAIKKGLKEVKKQLGVVKVCVAKADKGKTFWTMVSSANVDCSCSLSSVCCSRSLITDPNRLTF